MIGTETKLPSQLIISEVYYDDYVDKKGKTLAPDEERIEIFNLGSGDFQGSFTLSGKIFSGEITSYTYTDIFLPAKSFIILANTGYFFRLPSPDGLLINDLFDFPAFDISDREELSVELLQDDRVVDTFSVDSSWVYKRDNKQMSFQKIILPDRYIISNSMEYIVNIDDEEYAGNPRAILITDDDDRADYSLPKVPKPVDPPVPNRCLLAEEDVLSISEVFRGNERYDPYVEFFLHEDIEWEYDAFFLSGSLLVNSPLEINLDNSDFDYFTRNDLEKNTRVILTQTQDGELSGAGLLTIVYHPDF